MLSEFVYIYVSSYWNSARCHVRDIKTFLAHIRQHSSSLFHFQKSHFQRKKISFNSLTLNSVYAYRLLFEMAVWFGDASRFVRIYTHTNAIQIRAKAYWTGMVSVLIRIFPISIGVLLLVVVAVGTSKPKLFWFTWKFHPDTLFWLDVSSLIEMERWKALVDLLSVRAYVCVWSSLSKRR